MKIVGSELPPVDVVIGGSPCQGLSVAGKREGLADGRSGLFMEQIRVVKELREHDRRNGRTGELLRPRYMVWENVEGALSSPGGKNRGADFGAVLEEIVRVAEPDAPLFLCLKKDGPGPGACMEWTEGGALRGAYSTADTGDRPRRLMAECCISGPHNGVAESRLWRILEASPHPKYYLSAKACQGILNRAAKRGKELPPELETALVQRIRRMEENT